MQDYRTPSFTTPDAAGEPAPFTHSTDSMPFLEAWDAAAQQSETKRHGSGFRFLRELLQVAVVAALLFVGTRTVVQGREVRGPSMQPAYQTGQRLFVTRYFFSDPSRGDVVVFHPPSPARDDYIKRVIGIPGDRVQVRNGRVLVNDEPLSEGYLPDGAQTSCAGRWCDVTLGPDEYYVMGDNRPNSSDSRAWGPVREDTIVGKAWLLYYPFSDFGLAP